MTGRIYGGNVVAWFFPRTFLRRHLPCRVWLLQSATAGHVFNCCFPQLNRHVPRLGAHGQSAVMAWYAEIAFAAWSHYVLIAGMNLFARDICRDVSEEMRDNINGR